MSTSNRYWAFLAYLLSVVGFLFVLLFRPRDPLAVYHARQSLMLALVAVAAPLAWAICAWALGWVPLAGPILAAMLFALVIAAYIALLVGWIVGMVYALRGRMARVPLFGRWAERLPVGRVQIVVAPPPRPAPETPLGDVAESTERRTTLDA